MNIKRVISFMIAAACCTGVMAENISVSSGSDTLINVISNGEVVYTGSVNDFDNGAWVWLDIENIDCAAVFDWESTDLMYIISEQEQSIAGTEQAESSNMNFSSAVSADTLSFTDSDGQYSIDIAFFGDGGYTENIDSGVTFEVGFTNNTSTEKQFIPFFAVYSADGRLKSVSSGDIVTASAYSEAVGEAVLGAEDISDTDIIKAMIWNPQTMQPYIDTQIMLKGTADIHPDSYTYANVINDLSKPLCGTINSADDEDWFCLKTEETEYISFSIFSENDLNVSLYNASNSYIAGGTEDFQKSLSAGTYYLCIDSDAYNFEYSVLISVMDDGSGGFDIYKYDEETNALKQEIRDICDNIYDNNADNAKQIYDEYESILAEEAELHKLPEVFDNYPKEADDFKEKAGYFYRTRYDELISVKQKYKDIITEYDGESGYEYDGCYGFHHGGTAPVFETGLEPSAGLMGVGNEPLLTIDDVETDEITYTVRFPHSGANGNIVMLIDFNTNDGRTGFYSLFTKDGETDINVTNATRRLRALKPGGFYILCMMWSTDGGDTYGGENTIYRRFQTDYTGEAQKVTRESKYIKTLFESSAMNNTYESIFTDWLDRMDKVYEELRDMTGNIPYAGRKIVMESSRRNLSDIKNIPDGQNKWEVIYGWSGNPVEMCQPFVNSHMLRLEMGDWGDLPIHELSHDFDMPQWEFDGEALAFFKMYYVMKNLNAYVYRTDVATYETAHGTNKAEYKGTQYYDFLKYDCYIGYTGYFDKGQYSSGGMAAVLIEALKTADYEALKKTFRYMASLGTGAPSDNGEKLKLFLTKLKDYSGVDVIGKMKADDKAVIANHFGITLEYCTAPKYPGIGGVYQPSVNISDMTEAVYEFTAEKSGIYNIFTSKYGDSGMSNDTVIEVYTDEKLENEPIGTNDDYGNSRFSKISISLTEGQKYYIRVRHSRGETLHTKLTVTAQIPVQVLTEGEYIDISTAAGDFEMFSFTPQNSMMYTIYANKYGNEETEYDTYLKLYADEDMTQLLEYNPKRIIYRFEAGKTYYIQFSGLMMRYARARVGIRQAQTLEFQKRTDANFIYVNSPEYITNRDIVDDTYYDTGEGLNYKRKKIFEETDISGFNTMYLAGNAWWSYPEVNGYYPVDDFYLDIDFYNPNNTDITITVNNLVNGTEYSLLQNYYNGYGAGKTITIPSKGHKLLFEELNAPFLITDKGADLDKYARKREIFVLFDFEVSGGNTVVSALAAYDRNNLKLADNSINVLQNGEETDSGEVIHNYLTERENEGDLYAKQKGIARGEGAWIDAELEFVIDENMNLGKALPIYLKDNFFTQGIANPKEYWMTSVSPLNDKWDGVLYGLPQSLPMIKYHFGSTGRLWNFDFLHRDLRDINLNGGENEAVNSEIDSTVIDKVRAAAASGDRNAYFGKEQAPDDYSLGIGAFGVTYHYTVTIRNATDEIRTAKPSVRNFDELIFGLKQETESAYNISHQQYSGQTEDSWRSPFEVELLPGKTTTFEYITMIPFGRSGTNHRIIID